MENRQFVQFPDIIFFLIEIINTASLLCLILQYEILFQERRENEILSIYVRNWFY